MIKLIHTSLKYVISSVRTKLCYIVKQPIFQMLWNTGYRLDVPMFIFCLFAPELKVMLKETARLPAGVAPEVNLTERAT